MRRRRHPDSVVADIIARLNERDLYRGFSTMAKRYGVILDAVLAGKRSKRVVMARDACIMLLVRDARMSTTEAGEILGMHHTSIMAARNRYLERDNGKLAA